jgi:hypothetical protein
MMYAGRKRMQEYTKKCWKNSATFTQHYLPDFIDAHPELTKEWNIVYDARGEFIEPHGGRTVELGTRGVRGYIAGWTPTTGRAVVRSREGGVAPAEPHPTHFVRCENCLRGPESYKFVLLVEKEGFADLLAHHRIADRYDLALAWTKGVSTTAARELVQALSERGVTILVLHDFDLAGLTILHTLRTNTRRFRFRVKPNVVDIGLRLDDVRRLGLDVEEKDGKEGKDGEEVTYKRKKDPRETLAALGATAEEQKVLVKGHNQERKLWEGRRVELNELTNQQWIENLEGKLAEHGVQKIVPAEAVLRSSFEEGCRTAIAAAELEKARREADRVAAAASLPIPENLAARVKEKQTANPLLSWNEALADVAREAMRRR